MEMYERSYRCGLMWNFDKIQQDILSHSLVEGCGLMWNFDKIQLRQILIRVRNSCGLMWNFDKIQRTCATTSSPSVVV